MQHLRSAAPTISRHGPLTQSSDFIHQAFSNTSCRMTERRALPPPSGDLFVLSDEALQTTVRASRDSPRRRMIQPFHRSEQDTLHRMFNAVQLDSYVRPHRHLDPPKAEAWIVLRGAVVFFTFEENGAIRDCIELRASGPAFGVDLVPGVFHSFLAIEPDTVVYEVKTGPYSACDDKTFASFAPAEGTAEAPRISSISSGKRPTAPTVSHPVAPIRCLGNSECNQTGEEGTQSLAISRPVRASARNAWLGGRSCGLGRAGFRSTPPTWRSGCGRCRPGPGWAVGRGRGSMLRRRGPGRADPGSWCPHVRLGARSASVILLVIAAAPRCFDDQEISCLQ